MNPYQEEYENLANAIILQAVTDWRRAVHHPRSKDARQIREETEAFFLSGWFEMLTNVDGKWLLEKLKKEARVD